MNLRLLSLCYLISQRSGWSATRTVPGISILRAWHTRLVQVPAHTSTLIYYAIASKTATIKVGQLAMSQLCHNVCHRCHIRVSQSWNGRMQEPDQLVPSFG